MPWYDQAGRFSAFKLVVFLLLLVPGVLIAYGYASGALGPRPINEAVHQFGNWTLKLLLVSLAITPARTLLRWPRIMQVRRMVGVAAFAYASVHLTLYVADQSFDLAKVVSEIALRIYLLIGFVALLVLTAMAATSTDGMIRHLGPRRWRQLHRLVYPATLLAVVHFFMQTKFTVDEPWVMAGLFLLLMSFQLVAWRGLLTERGVQWWPATLAVLAGLATAGVEAAYYWLKVGVPPLRVLQTNVTFALGVRPSWTVLAIGLVAALVGILRRRSPRQATTPARAGAATAAQGLG